MSEWISQDPRAKLTLAEGEIHVWVAWTANTFWSRPVVTAGEMTRAERFRHVSDRDEYLISRSLLRLLAGAYTGRECGSVTFECNPFGKPFIQGSDLSFSISHSSGYVLLAFALGRQVGVDIEKIDPAAVDRSVLKRALAPSEFANIKRLPSHRKNEYFFNIWTRKEAYTKACGTGLITDPAGIEIDEKVISPDSPVRHSVFPRWRCIELPNIPGFATSLVVEGCCTIVPKFWAGTELSPSV